MAQTVRNITRDQVGKSGMVFQEHISLVNPDTVSDLLLLPADHIYAIFASVGATGSLQWSFDDLATLNANTSVTWVTWNGTDPIPVGATAIQFTRSSGTVACRLVVKTAGAGN